MVVIAQDLELLFLRHRLHVRQQVLLWMLHMVVGQHLLIFLRQPISLGLESKLSPTPLAV